MESKLNLGNLYDKNINFLFGSGASTGYLPTLSLKVGRDVGETNTVESLGQLWELQGKLELRTLLFMHYYSECILPAMNVDFGELSKTQLNVFENYFRFLNTVIQTINKSPSSTKKCNIFTTNYDSCFEISMDRLVEHYKLDFLFNDGSRGFTKKYLHAKNYNTRTYNTGVFERHQTRMPQINLIHLHGSVYWKAHEKKIVVDYSSRDEDPVPESCLVDLTQFREIANNPAATISDFDGLSIDTTHVEQFWIHYNQLPIVNPTKWKFHETVFDEHYYQMLRYMSYELEVKNSILIVFGFSFADEHIRHLVQRSLSNPTLHVYICCFNEQDKIGMEDMFREYANVSCACIESNLDFDAFNSEVFHLPSDQNDIKESEKSEEIS